jgi:regulator of sigma D
MNDTNPFGWLNDQQREKVMQTCKDVATIQGGGFGDLVRALERLCQPLVNFWSASDFSFPSRAEIRREKRERRQARHYAMTHGKHGLKRPRGKRNVARD